MTHPLTDEMIDEIFANRQWWQSPDNVACLRAAYDVGYAQSLEDLQDIIICIQRKDSPAMPVTLEELEAMRPQIVDLPQANSDVCGEEGMERARQQTFEENDELMRLLADS